MAVDMDALDSWFDPEEAADVKRLIAVFKWYSKRLA